MDGYGLGDMDPNVIIYVEIPHFFTRKRVTNDVVHAVKMSMDVRLGRTKIDALRFISD